MTTNLTRDEARARSALVETHSYDVALDIRLANDREQATYTSSSKVSFTARSSGEIFLDFIADSVTSIEANGQSIDPAAAFDGARVTVPVEQGENTVTIVGQALYSRSGEGMHRFFDPADGKCYIYTQFEPTDARRVYANFDQPDLKAVFRFTVTAPNDFTVLNNTAVVRTEPAGALATTHYFGPTLRQSSYITCVCAGHYVSAHSEYVRGDLRIPLGVYTRASLAEAMESDEIFTITKAGLDFFHENFDYAYPWGKYDQIFVPEYNLGAMENPGLVTFVDSYIHRDAVTRSEYESRASVILHEMAHMWFGDLVTMQWWDDLWLKESFADYMAALALSEATEYTDGWVSFALRRKDWAYRQDQYATTHPIVADIPDVEAARQNFDGITYAKGASVLKQLVAFVGRDVFMKGSRAYFRAHEFSNTSLEDFLLALEKAAGDRDVRGWADKWLKTTGVSELSLTITTESSAADSAARDSQHPSLRDFVAQPTVTSAVISQHNTVAPAVHEFTAGTATGVTRPHTLQVAGFNRAGGTLEKVGAWPIDFADESAQVTALRGQPRPDLLLLGHGDDDFAKIRLDANSTAIALRSVTKLDDALDRAIVWSALGNAARDGLLPALDFTEAYARTLGRETHAGIASGLRVQALNAIDRWMGEADRQAAISTVLGAALDALEDAQAGSDTQLDLAETVLLLVRRTSVEDTGPEALAAREWVTHLLTVPAGQTVNTGAQGLRVDNALRWKALITLVCLGWADHTDIEAEATLDRSSSGELHTYTARAAMPLPVAKMRAFTSAVEDTGLSNSKLSATVMGFAASSRGSMLEPFVEQYFDRLESFWTTRSNEIGKRLVLGLYPTWSARGEHVAELTRTWLAFHLDAPRALRRMVVELLAEQERAVRLKQRRS